MGSRSPLALVASRESIVRKGEFNSLPLMRGTSGYTDSPAACHRCALSCSRKIDGTRAAHPGPHRVSAQNSAAVAVRATATGIARGRRPAGGGCRGRQQNEMEMEPMLMLRRDNENEKKREKMRRRLSAGPPLARRGAGGPDDLLPVRRVNFVFSPFLGPAGARQTPKRVGGTDRDICGLVLRT